MKITIYGVSDDLIEIEGDLLEEFAAMNTPIYLAISDGTLLIVHYDNDGFWRINQRFKGSAEMHKQEASDVDSDYSDRVTLSGDIRWILKGDEMHKIEG